METLQDLQKLQNQLIAVRKRLDCNEEGYRELRKEYELRCNTRLLQQQDKQISKLELQVLVLQIVCMLFASILIGTFIGRVLLPLIISQ
jgi:glycine betaine/choline ABC-type transport system substrate-binding protein